MNRSFKKSFAGRKRLASTFVDMLAGLAMSATLVSLVAIDLQSRRETARNSQCQNNLRNIGIAIFSYHRTYQHFPIHGTGTHQESSGTAGHGDAGSRGVGGQGGGNNGKQLSMFVGILPFMGQQDLWDQISQRSSDTVHGKLAEDAYWPAMGPATSQRNYLPWITDLSLLRCPTDPRTGEITGRTNYAACLGDAIDAQMDSALRFDPMTASWNVDPQMADRVRAAARGAFVFRERMSFADISDGLSNTLLIGEIATSLGDRDCRTTPALRLGATSDNVPLHGGLFDSSAEAMMFLDPQRPRYWLPNDSPRAPVIPTAVDRHRGMRWADAATVFSGFNTIRPPNSTIAVAGDDIRNPTIASVSSHHHGGAHVLRCDGSTDFFANSVEAGDAWGGSVRLGMTGPLSPGSPSPFGYWGAMGTRAANDSDSPPL